MTTEHPAAGVSALAPRDQEAITRTLTSLLAGFSERDVGKLADVSLHVLQRQGDGTWPVVSEMYMDANRDQSYAGHS